MKNKYINFLNESFPKLSLEEEEALIDIYKTICENNIFTDSFKNKLCLKYEHAKDEYFEYYRNQLNKILIYVGINDKNVIDFCFRLSVEYLLKLLYSIKNNLDIKEINKKSFRFLSEDLKNTDSEIYTGMVDDISILLSYYGKFSNEIHGKIEQKTELEYMDEILKNKDTRFMTIKTQLSKLVKIYEKIFIKILQMNLKNVDAGLIFRLSNIMSNKRIKKLFWED